MLTTLIVLALILWLLGLILELAFGGLIHLLLGAAIVMIVVKLLKEDKTV